MLRPNNVIKFGAIFNTVFTTFIYKFLQVKAHGYPCHLKILFPPENRSIKILSKIRLFTEYSLIFYDFQNDYDTLKS